METQWKNFCEKDIAALKRVDFVQILEFVGLDMGQSGNQINRGVILWDKVSQQKVISVTSFCCGEGFRMDTPFNNPSTSKGFIKIDSSCKNITSLLQYNQVNVGASTSGANSENQSVVQLSGVEKDSKGQDEDNKEGEKLPDVSTEYVENNGIKIRVFKLRYENQIQERVTKVRKATIYAYWSILHLSAVMGHLVITLFAFKQMCKCASGNLQLQSLMECFTWLIENVKASKTHLNYMDGKIVDLPTELQELKTIYKMGGTKKWIEADLVSKRSWKLLELLFKIQKWLQDAVEYYEGKTACQMVQQVVILSMHHSAYDNFLQKYLHHHNEALDWAVKAHQRRNWQIHVDRDGDLVVSSVVRNKMQQIQDIIDKANYAVSHEIDFFML